MNPPTEDPQGPLEYTGERMVPELTDPDTFWDHIYRYRFATPYVKGKRVLDIACGEGYGSAALLDAGAKSVIGIDISEETCRHARQKYKIDARVGSAEEIPLPKESVEVVVSFETIEHLQHPERFLDECLRILTPEGWLIVSTPNKASYRHSHPEGEESPPGNPYHHHEMDEQEFKALLSERFHRSEMYTQRPMKVAWASPLLFAPKTPSPQPFRGFQRLQIQLQRWICPHLKGGAATSHRLHTSEIIRNKDSWISYLVNPHLVRRQARINRELPLYFVAVAQKEAAVNDI